MPWAANSRASPAPPPKSSSCTVMGQSTSSLDNINRHEGFTNPVMSIVLFAAEDMVDSRNGSPSLSSIPWYERGYLVVVDSGHDAGSVR